MPHISSYVNLASHSTRKDFCLGRLEDAFTACVEDNKRLVLNLLGGGREILELSLCSLKQFELKFLNF